MSIVNTQSAKIVGINAVKITVETYMSPGIGIHLVGLADTAVKESLLRVITALQSQGYHVPGEKIIINLAPTDITKDGPGHDLAIALSILAAGGRETMNNLDQYLLLGELSLDGRIRSVNGTVPTVLLAKTMNLKGCIIPADNIEEVRPFVEDFPIYGAASLREAIEVIQETDNHIPTIKETPVRKQEIKPFLPNVYSWDYIYENEGAKRAIEIAAAGGHNLLMVGAPGSQKTIIANALAELLPPPVATETEEIMRIYSASGKGQSINIGQRPFRAPHYSASLATMIGGGAGYRIAPGEVSLASGGILFLDELPSFPKSLIESLRGPIEDKKVVISRLKSKIEYPAHFQLVAAMNPCPCGYYGVSDRCTCTAGQRAAYLARVSGPIMDRLTMQVYTHIPKKLEDESKNEPIGSVRERVAAARDRQKKRYAGTSITCNEDMTSHDLEKYCILDSVQKEFIEKLVNHMGLSARAYTRIIKIARTIADLAGSEEVTTVHLAEAASYRFLDKLP